MYGVSIDESMSGNEFEYLIADNYNPAAEIPDGFVTKVIPEYTWAIFPCRGAMPDSPAECKQENFLRMAAKLQRL